MKTQTSKPSIAARELAGSISNNIRLMPADAVERMAGLIDAHLGDLLEKAKWLIIYAEAADLMSPSFVAMKSALEPWKLGE